MGILPNPLHRALAQASQDFRAGDDGAAAAALRPWLTRSAQAARESLALSFLDQDYSGALALALSVPAAAGDDEARLWLARSAGALARWDACLDQLKLLKDPRRPWALNLRAEALNGLQDPGAEGAFVEALSATAGTRLESYTEVLAAEAAEARGDDAAAEALYKRAEKADPSYTLVNLRLAALYRRHERWREARQRLERERRVDPDSEGPRDELNALLAALPEQRRDLKRDEAAKLAEFSKRSNPCVGSLAQSKGEPGVRVGLITGAAAFKFRMGGAMVDRALGLTLPADSAWTATAGASGTWTLAALDAKTAAPRVLAGALRLQPLDPSCTFGLFEVDHGAGYFFARRDDSYYRGALEITPTAEGLTVINELGMESYLLSVVPSEVPHTWPMAALKAQAIAARTEAWGSLGRYRSRGYDLCPTVLCAVYSGVGAEDARTTAAVTLTAGVVMELGTGKLAPANYMDNSGGHTIASSEVWPDLRAGTVGVADCPDSARATRALFPVSPASLLHFIDDIDGDVQGWPMHEGHATWRWTLRMTPDEMQPALDRRRKVGTLRSVVGLERSEGGILKRVRILGTQGDFIASSDRIRTALKGLKSNLFYVEPRFAADGSTQALIFHGGGWGHGVGMSQSGALEMAQDGLDETDILRHYFPRQKLHKRYPR
jgi:SpoIID/LytB domain protein